MIRSKLLAVLAALLAVGGASYWFLGSAHAAEWRVYAGDVHPGHAYGLTVPAGAQALEVALENGTGSAVFALYDPAQERLGFYELDGVLPAAEVASPAPGRYTLVVYEVKDGALKLRVDAKDATDLSLQTLKLVREDVRIGASDEPARLDRAFTTKLKAAPVFVTLLYEGSAEGLDATVASEKGDVLTITGERGTAMAPGVFTDQAGARVFDHGNVMGRAYTVTVHAARFQGTLDLTTLSIEVPAPTPPVAWKARTEQPPAPPAPPKPASPNATTQVRATDPGVVQLARGHAFALRAEAGDLVLADPKAGGRNGSADALALVFLPNDTLLAAVPLKGSNASATVALPEAGEYVVYVAHADHATLLAKVPGGDGEARRLALGKEQFRFGAGPYQEAAPFEVKRVPVAFHLDAQDGVAALGWIEVRNGKGLVFAADDLARVGGFSLGNGQVLFHERLAAGPHELATNGLLSGSLVLTAIHYLREAPLPEENAPHEHEADGTHEPLAPTPHEPHGHALLPRVPLALPRVI